MTKPKYTPIISKEQVDKAVKKLFGPAAFVHLKEGEYGQYSAAILGVRWLIRSEPSFYEDALQSILDFTNTVKLQSYQQENYTVFPSALNVTPGFTGVALSADNSIKAHYLHGQLDRRDGPAVEYAIGKPEYWLQNTLFPSYQEYLKQLNNF